MQSANKPIQLTCKNLSLGYEDKTVVENLNFTVCAGDYLCIVGENGSGKSTLVKSLLHLLKPKKGEIIFNEGFEAGQIGYLPQQTVVQRDFPASVKEIVLSGCLSRCGWRPFYTKEERNIAKHNMERLGVYELRNSCYRELSGGQQQRVLLARALGATGRVLVLDEPVTGLDPKAVTEMYEIIKSLNDEGITIVMISHDIDSALKYASHILHIGTNAFFGTKEEYADSVAAKSFKTSEVV